jgi:hypothetical protein
MIFLGSRLHQSLLRLAWVRRVGSYQMKQSQQGHIGWSNHGSHCSWSDWSLQSGVSCHKCNGCPWEQQGKIFGLQKVRALCMMCQQTRPGHKLIMVMPPSGSLTKFKTRSSSNKLYSSVTFVFVLWLLDTWLEIFSLIGCLYNKAMITFSVRVNLLSIPIQ